MKTRSLSVAISGITAVAISLFTYALSQMSVEHLIVCALDESSRIPAFVCDRYLSRERMTADDIAALQSGAGLDFILNGNNPRRYEIARSFVANGLDVNGENHNTRQVLTPLQSAIVFNDIERVKFLVQIGADPGLKNSVSGLTAVELARSLAQRQGDRYAELLAYLHAFTGPENQHKK